MRMAAGAAARALRLDFGAPWPDAPRRILIVHRLLLGDTLMLTALLKKLRTLHPQAELVMTMQKAFLPLYAGRPYGVQAIAFEPRDPASVQAIVASGPYDLGIVPGDNRHSWLAYAAGCRHIVAHGGDRPAWKSLPVHTQRPYAGMPTTWGDMVAQLVPGPAPTPFEPQEWPLPPCAPFTLPPEPYAVLHLGASNPLRGWFAPRWAALAQRLAGQGLRVVWTAGASEAGLVAAADPQGLHLSLAGKTDLAQLLHLLRGARLLVCPDTGVAHLARITATPSVVLYGPGSVQSFGIGDFWRQVPQRELIEDPFACRDQHHLFKRQVLWLNRCDRRAPACTHAACMEPLTVDRALAAAVSVMNPARQPG